VLSSSKINGKKKKMLTGDDSVVRVRGKIEAINL
jgi:hypothetical protein